jgi:ABC-type nitrate/sulfonate/bicarbonate transport system permease component
MPAEIKRPRRISRELMISIAAVVVVVGLWETSIDLKWVVSPFAVAPSSILVAMFNLWAGGSLPADILATVARMLAGFILGVVFGALAGLLMGWIKEIRAVLTPFVSIIYPLPKIALLPLIMLFLGIGEAPMILVIALGAFFPVLINSVAGVLNIEPIYFDAARNYGAGNYKLFTTIILPGSMPMIVAGIRIAVGISLLVSVSAELAMGNSGLGAMLWMSWQTLRVVNIYVGILTVAILGLLMYWLVDLFSRRTITWKE